MLMVAKIRAQLLESCPRSPRVQGKGPSTNDPSAAPGAALGAGPGASPAAHITLNGAGARQDRGNSPTPAVAGAPSVIRPATAEAEAGGRRAHDRGRVGSGTTAVEAVSVVAEGVAASAEDIISTELVVWAKTETRKTERTGHA